MAAQRASEKGARTSVLPLLGRLTFLEEVAAPEKAVRGETYLYCPGHKLGTLVYVQLVVNGRNLVAHRSGPVAQCFAHLFLRECLAVKGNDAHLVKCEGDAINGELFIFHEFQVMGSTVVMVQIKRIYSDYLSQVIVIIVENLGM